MFTKKIRKMGGGGVSLIHFMCNIDQKCPELVVILYNMMSIGINLMYGAYKSRNVMLCV